MDKIFNNVKVNIYGGVGMIHKYIYMKREDKENKMYFIYQIESIINDKFPIIYKCNKSYVLVVPKNANKPCTVLDKLKNIELTNNDVLYNMDINEYLKIFKLFVEYQGTIIKITDNVFEK